MAKYDDTRDRAQLAALFESPRGADRREMARLREECARLQQIVDAWERTDALNRLSAAEEEIATMTARAEKAEAEIEEWRCAAMLTRGGDPDGVTPADLELDRGQEEIVRKALATVEAALHWPLSVAFVPACDGDPTSVVETATKRMADLATMTARAETAEAKLAATKPAAKPLVMCAGCKRPVADGKAWHKWCKEGEDDGD